VKVDREERPDIAQVYMNSVHLISGRGGWPLNIIALPDGRPVFGGSYFPKNQWMTLLSRIHTIYQEDPDQIIEQAKAITQGVRNLNDFKIAEEVAEFRIDIVKSIVENWKQNMDFDWGGHLGAPKFPIPVGLQFLLHYYAHTQDEHVFRFLKVTLDRMAQGGIYDQIGGGFARYSVDGYWKVPHFEKMLYDNGQLVSFYCMAYRLMKDKLYESIVRETLAFVERELMSPEGGFYSALDADSEGEEGKFYIWETEEVDSLLGDRADLIKAYYSLRREGNWEDGKNVLFRNVMDDVFASQHNLSNTRLSEILSDAKQEMFRARSKRIPPAVDTKILTAWNGIMLKGFVDAYRVFDEHHYLEVALKNGEFLVRNMLSNDHHLDRSYKDGGSSVNGFLDDYAFIIDAFVGLYQATFDEKWLTRADQLMRYTLNHFFDGNRGLFYYKSDLDPELIARNIEISDNVIPASNSVMAHNLFVLGHYFAKGDYIDKSRIMLSHLKKKLQEGGVYYANWSRLILRFVAPVHEVAIVGQGSFEKRKALDHHYLPNIILLGSTGDSVLPLLEHKFQPGKTMIYVCQNKTCQQPVTNVEDALKQLR